MATEAKRCEDRPVIALRSYDLISGSGRYYNVETCEEAARGREEVFKCEEESEDDNGKWKMEKGK